MITPIFRRDTRAGTSFPAALIFGFALLAGSAIALNPSSGQAAGNPGQTHLPAPQSQQIQPPNPGADMNPSPLTPKQQRDLQKANFAKMKQDADELAALAKSLQDEVNKSNANVLSLGVVEKADKIEKLAKKIKNSALQ